MKKINPDHVDKLFSNMKEESINADFFQMDDIEMRLENERFYKFGWKHFNIYYVLLMFIHFGITVGLLANYLINFTEGKSAPKHFVKENTYKDTLHSTTIVPKQAEEVKLKTSFKIKKETGSQNEESKAIQITKSDSLLIRENKSIEQIEYKVSPKTISIDSIKPSKPKRIIYVKKRDTIIQFDTTKTIRKK